MPEHRGERTHDLDLPGLAALAAGMTALTLAVMEAPAWGWGSATTIGLLLASIVIFFAWHRIESRAREPLVDPAVLRGGMLGANFVAFCVPFVLTGLAVLISIYLQNVLSYSALETGVLMLPMTIPLLIGSVLAGSMIARIGARALVTGGMLAAGAGVFAVGAGAGRNEYEALVPGLLLFGFGAAIALPAMTTTIMASATAARRGMVSGVYNTARLVGGTIGLAVMGSVLATLEASKLAAEQADGNLSSVEGTHIHSLLAGGQRGSEALDGLSHRAAREVEAGARTVFDSGFAETMKLSALVAVAGAVVAFVVIPRLRAQAPEHVPVELQPLQTDG